MLVSVHVSHTQPGKEGKQCQANGQDVEDVGVFFLLIISGDARKQGEGTYGDIMSDEQP